MAKRQATPAFKELTNSVAHNSIRLLSNPCILSRLASLEVDPDTGM